MANPISPARSLVILFCLTVFAGCGYYSEERLSPETQSRSLGNYRLPRFLCVFMDGTDNDERSQTNVRHLYEVFSAAKNPSVLCYYQTGVGAESDGIKGFRGKLTGGGFSKRIADGYAFLACNYRPGDRIIMFGYSRGARQVQVLCHFIACEGLPDRPHAPENYQDGRKHAAAEALASFEKWKDQGAFLQECSPSPRKPDGCQCHPNRPPPIEFVGLWDSVESLGSNVTSYLTRQPRRIGGNKLGYVHHPDYGRHFPCNVRFACHAMALDEQRGLYEVVPWNETTRTKRRLEQVWFPGSHGDVGGGYPQSQDLASLSLNWMLESLESRRALPLHGIGRVHADPFARITNSRDFSYSGRILDNIVGTSASPRWVSFWRDQTGEIRRPKIHASVIARMEKDAIGWPADTEKKGKYRPRVFWRPDAADDRKPPVNYYLSTNIIESPDVCMKSLKRDVEIVGGSRHWKH